jgi:hypothetical protein
MMSKHVAVYICYKRCITQYILWMIYWLLFNLALFHCTIKDSTYRYRPTAVHDISITISFSAFNCAVFNSSVYVCYMWQWVVWRVYWLYWMETGQMWISILWTLCGLFNWNLLRNCAVQTEDTLKNISHCLNGIKLFYWCTSSWINYKPCVNSTAITTTNLISIFSKWTVQSLHLHNLQLTSQSTSLHSLNWIEEFEVDIWMKNCIYIANCM